MIRHEYGHDPEVVPDGGRWYSALFTLAHNLAVGAALVASFDAGWEASDDARHRLECWHPNVDGKEMPR